MTLGGYIYIYVYTRPRDCVGRIFNNSTKRIKLPHSTLFCSQAASTMSTKHTSSSCDSDRNHQHSLNAPSIQNTSGSSQGVTNITVVVDCDYVPSLTATAGPSHEYIMNGQLEVIPSIGTYSEGLEIFRVKTKTCQTHPQPLG